MSECWLLADLGGTNTRVGLAGPKGLETGSLQSYRNDQFDGLVALLQTYLKQTQPSKIHALCAGVAGPVRDGAAQLTNHEWYIDSASLRVAIGANSVVLLNDLQAQGYALDDLTGDQLMPLFAGAMPPASATRLVMGLGTGCNAAVVHMTSSGLFVPPAESGHTSLPYATGKLGELIDHLGTHHPHRPIESALSGPGLSNIYAFLTGHTLPSEQILSAHHTGDAQASQALRLMCQLLGKVAGDLALTHLPMGGFFFIGGMARAVAPLLEEMGFYDQFIAKGPYAPILRDIPVSLIKDDSAALLGCARHLHQQR